MVSKLSLKSCFFLYKIKILLRLHSRKRWRLVLLRQEHHRSLFRLTEFLLFGWRFELVGGGCMLSRKWIYLLVLRIRQFAYFYYLLWGLILLLHSYLLTVNYIHNELVVVVAVVVLAKIAFHLILYTLGLYRLYQIGLELRRCRLILQFYCVLSYNLIYFFLLLILLILIDFINLWLLANYREVLDRGGQ